MNIAIIGTGMIAGYHAKAIQAHGDTLKLVISKHPDHAESFAENFRIPKAKERIEEEDWKNLQAVFVCTPPESHLEYVRKALEHQIPVFCEKPLALDCREAQEMAELEESSGCITALGFNSRFYPGIQKMKDMVKTMGPLTMISGHYYQEFHCLPAPYSWRYTEPYRALSEIGSHYIDLIRYLTGQEFSCVQGCFETVHPQRVVKEGVMYAYGEGTPVTISNEDIVSAMMKLQDGTLVNMVLNETAAGCSNDLSAEVFTPSSSVSWSSERPYQIETANHGKGRTVWTDAFGGGFTETFLEEDKAFLDAVCLNQKDERLAGFRDGLMNARVLKALSDSAQEEGKRIYL